MPRDIRNAVITLNNPTALAKIAFKAFATSEKVKYSIAAFEIGESGTPHIQAYFQLKAKMNFNTFKSHVPGAHIESAKGTGPRNKEYCSKGRQPHTEWEALGISGPNYGKDVNIFFEHGEMKTQGERTDLAEIAQMTIDGASIQDIAMLQPETFIKFHKGILAHRAAVAQPRSTDTAKEVIVHIGSTGTGKTKTAFEEHPDAHIQGNECGKWFDGYDQHKVVILEEFRGQLPFGYLLRLTDRYPMKVEFKGGMTEFIADKIIITAPEHPGLWYAKLEQRDGKMAQFKRRITKILEFHTFGQPPIDITEKDWPTPEPVAFGFPANQFE